MMDNRKIEVPAEFLWELLEHLDKDKNSEASVSFGNDVRKLLGVPVNEADLTGSEAL